MTEQYEVRFWEIREKGKIHAEREREKKHTKQSPCLGYHSLFNSNFSNVFVILWYKLHISRCYVKFDETDFGTWLIYSRFFSSQPHIGSFLFHLLPAYFISFSCCTNCFLTLPVIKHKWIEKPLIRRSLSADCVSVLIFPPAGSLFCKGQVFFKSCLIFIILRGQRKPLSCSLLHWQKMHILTHTH